MAMGFAFGQTPTLDINSADQQNLQIADSYHDFYNNKTRVTDSGPAHRLIKHTLNNIVIQWAINNQRQTGARGFEPDVNSDDFSNTNIYLQNLFQNGNIKVSEIEDTTATALGVPQTETIHYSMRELDAPRTGEALCSQKLGELLGRFGIPNDGSPVGLVCDAGNSVVGALANITDSRIKLIITPQTFADSASTPSDRSQSPGKDKPWRRARINQPPQYIFPNNNGNMFISNGNLFTRGKFAIGYAREGEFDGQNTAFRYQIFYKQNPTEHTLIANIPYNYLHDKGFKKQGPSVKLLAADIAEASGWLPNDRRDPRYNINNIRAAANFGVVKISDYLQTRDLQPLSFDIKRCGDRDQAEAAILIQRANPTMHIIYSAGDELSAVIAAKHGIKTIFQRIHGNDGIITIYNGQRSIIQPPLFNGGGASSTGPGGPVGESSDDSWSYGTESGQLDQIAELAYDINNFLRNFIVNHSGQPGKVVYSNLNQSKHNLPDSYGGNEQKLMEILKTSPEVIAYYQLINNSLGEDSYSLKNDYNLFQHIADINMGPFALIAYGLLYDRFTNSTYNNVSVLSRLYYNEIPHEKLKSPPLNGTTIGSYASFLMNVYNALVKTNGYTRIDSVPVQTDSVSTPPRAGSEGTGFAFGAQPGFGGQPGVGLFGQGAPAQPGVGAQPSFAIHPQPSFGAPSPRGSSGGIDFSKHTGVGLFGQGAPAQPGVGLFGQGAPAKPGFGAAPAPQQGLFAGLDPSGQVQLAFNPHTQPQRGFAFGVGGRNRRHKKTQRKRRAHKKRRATRSKK